MWEYECRKCGKRNTIQEVSTVIRTIVITPNDEGDGFEYVENSDETHWDTDSVLGYECLSDECMGILYTSPDLVAKTVGAKEPEEEEAANE